MTHGLPAEVPQGRDDGGDWVTKRGAAQSLGFCPVPGGLQSHCGSAHALEARSFQSVGKRPVIAEDSPGLRKLHRVRQCVQGSFSCGKGAPIPRLNRTSQAPIPRIYCSETRDQGPGNWDKGARTSSVVNATALGCMPQVEWPGAANYARPRLADDMQDRTCVLMASGPRLKWQCL